MGFVSTIFLKALWGGWQWFARPNMRKMAFKKLSLNVSHILTKFCRLTVAISRDQAWHVLCSQLLSIGSNWEHVFISARIIVWLITMENLKDGIWQNYILTSPLSSIFCFHLVHDPPRERSASYTTQTSLWAHQWDLYIINEVPGTPSQSRC